MPMELIAPSLTDIGHLLFGPDWESCIAAALKLDDEDIQDLLADPTKIPPDFEAKMENIGLARIQEILLS